MNDLIFDAPSLYARCWYAASEDPPEVMRVFVQSVLHLLDCREGRIGLPIGRTLFCWEGRAKTDKGHKEKPQAYRDTRRQLQEALLTLFGTVHGYHPEYEADDIVATAAYDSKADRAIVVSGDKDLMQLFGGHVEYYCLNAKKLITAESICEKFKIKKPIQTAIALAIVGDPGDGIKGIPRWGPKRVAKLFESVTADMDFHAALEAVMYQIPECLHNFFLESLDKTLLHSGVPDVPEPSPLAFCTNKEVIHLGIEKIAHSYERVAMQYEDGDYDIS